MIPKNLTPLVWMQETSCSDDKLLLSYEVPYDKKNPLVLQQLDKHGTTVSVILIPKKCILGLSQELSKFINNDLLLDNELEESETKTVTITNVFLISKVLKRDSAEYFCVGKYLVKTFNKFEQGDYLTEDKNNKTREIVVMGLDKRFVSDHKEELITDDQEIILNLISKELELFPGIMLFKKDIIDPELEEILSEAQPSTDIIKREYSCDEVDCELLEARDKYINLSQTPKSQRTKKQE